MDLVLTVLQDPHEDLGQLCGLAITDRLIVAAGGTSTSATIVASSNARRFEPLKLPSTHGIRDVLVAADSLWVCGEYGLLAVSRDGGHTWTTLATDTRACLFGLALAPSGAIWIVGDEGYAAWLHGTRVERVAIGAPVRLAKVYSVKDEIVALGGDGAIRKLSETGEVATLASGSTRALTGLAITARNTWIVVGDGGFIARSPDGQWFSRVTTPVQLDLEAVGVARDGKIVAVGDRGQVTVSADDGRTWAAMKTQQTAHLWSVGRFGAGMLIGGDDGMILKLAPAGDATWHERPDMFGGPRPLDDVFAGGPSGFIGGGLAEFLGEAEPVAAIEEAVEDDVADDPDESVDREAFKALGRVGTAEDFATNYGVAMPAEARRFFALVEGHDRWSTFDELRLDNDLRPDVGALGLFELMVRRNQQAYLGTDLVEAFCGVFGIGSQGNGDTYHMEIYEWDGPRQVLHFDHETASFTGVFADSLDSLAYLCALVKAGDARAISREAYAAGLRALHGKVSPTWHFSIDEKDPEFTRLSPKRRDSEFFFYRSRWICALLKNDGVTDLDDIGELFDANLNQVIPPDQLAARYDACEKFIPTALYAMWRAFLFDEPELARYLEIARRHTARLVRDAARLIDELAAGRTRLGTIKDVPTWLARFRALDLDPRRAEARAAEQRERARIEGMRRDEVMVELVRTQEAEWPQLAWRWMADGTAHRALLHELQRRPDAAAQLAAIDALRDLTDDERAIVIPRLAAELSPTLEALLLGSLVRDDKLDKVVERGDPGPDPEPEPEPADADGAPLPPSARQIGAAIAMTERALRLAPDDTDVQFTHAMLLIDGDRAGLAGKDASTLLSALQQFAPSVRISIASKLGSTGHARFRDAVDLALADAFPTRVLASRTSGSVASFGDVASEMFAELGEVILEHAPDRMTRLVAKLPDDVELLCELAYKAIEAGQRDAAIALYDRMLALSIPDELEERQVYLRALNNACVQAHAGKVFDAAVRIANRAQPVAHENPYIYHAAACAYAATGDLARAFDQVKLAIDHDYDHVAKIESDRDLGALLEWPEFRSLFRDWHARQEGN